MVALSRFLVSAGLPSLALADAYWILSGYKNEDTPDHAPLEVPAGSTLRNITVGPKGEEVVTYWSDNIADDNVDHVIVMLHGRLRNGNDYWVTANDAYQSAEKDGYAGVSQNTLIVAPELFSTIRNSGEYTADQLAWADVNAWQILSPATHPVNTTVSSSDVYDGLLKLFADKSQFPNVKNVTLVGHGGGGQFMTRYAALGNDPPEGIWVRYIIGDPSSNLYFTDNRPFYMDTNGATKDNCPLYNTYRYGFVDILNSTLNVVPPQEAFKRIISRDVVWILGLEDTAADGDQTCAAFLLGGQERVQRNLIYWRYINELAVTGANLTGYPAHFYDLPDWSNVADGTFTPRLVTVPGAAHDAQVVFDGEQGRAVLFREQFPTGYTAP